MKRHCPNIGPAVARRRQCLPLGVGFSNLNGRSEGAKLRNRIQSPMTGLGRLELHLRRTVQPEPLKQHAVRNAKTAPRRGRSLIRAVPGPALRAAGLRRNRTGRSGGRGGYARR